MSENTWKDGERSGEGSWDKERTADELSQAWNKAKEGLGGLGRIIKEGAKASRHRVETTLLERERRQLLESIGKQVYEYVKEVGTDDFPPEIMNLCKRVAQLDGMIERERSTTRRHWDEATGSRSEDTHDAENSDNPDHPVHPNK